MHEFSQQSTCFFKRGFGLSILFCILVMPGISSANKPEDVTQAEMKLIPAYCADTMGFNYGGAYSDTSPRAGHWVSLMGKSFWHMHHYCWGQINLMRARKAGIPAQTRQSMLESVSGDYQYVIKNSPPDFIMLPEISTRVGDVELLLSHPEKANEAFSRARQLKPDYWPAYSHWAEYLISIGRRPEALKLITSGLEHSPNAKVLLDLYRTLGGKPAGIPNPVEKKQEEEQEARVRSPDAENTSPNSLSQPETTTDNK